MNNKILFIGNSIVAGYPWSEGRSFPGIIRSRTGYDVINKGVNGDTTDGIIGRFATDVLDHRPDTVFILTGTNDFIYREKTPSEAFNNLMQMAKMAEQKHIKPVFITPLPVDPGKAEYMWMSGMGISYPAVNRDLEDLSQLIRKSGRPFVDMNSLYRDFVKVPEDPDTAYLDGIHPMPAGYEFIAECIIDYLKESNE